MVLAVGRRQLSDARPRRHGDLPIAAFLLRRGGHNLNVGDEGGFAPSLPSNKDALDLVLLAVENAGYTPGHEVFLGLDVAATELYDVTSDKYVLEREGVSLDSEELIELYEGWVSQYPILH